MPRVLSRVVFLCAAAAILAAGAWWVWQKADRSEIAGNERPMDSGARPSVAPPPVRLSPQARKNLQLVSQPLKPTTYWRVVEFPGVIVDRPGITDRGVVAPIAGVVTRIHAYPGDVVEPGAALFTLRLNSESLYNSQLELYKATQDIEIEKRELERLAEAARSGAVAQTRIIDIQNDIQRLAATVRAYQQDLKARGLPSDRIDAASSGEFVTEIVVRAPDASEQRVAALALNAAPGETPAPDGAASSAIPFSFELHSLAVELGQQVDAGQVLCHLGDHRSLLIEGRGFKDDMPLVQQAVKKGWEVEAEFSTRAGEDWPPLPDRFPIDRVANTIDPESRTFGFHVALENQWQSYTRDGKARLLWRFRPGSQLRLRVPVEKFEKIFVVPQAALVWEGPESFVFQQDGEFFHRRPVQVLYEDRLNAVLAPDAGLRSGFYIAQSSASSLNRIMKSQAQASSGAPAGVHVHPDGTTHAAH